MTMKTQMDKLIGYQSGSMVSIDPSQRRGQVTPLPQVISTGPPLSPDAEKEYRPPTEEGSMTIQPVFPTVGSPEYERYLQAIKNLPEGGLESLPRISEEPDTPTTELSPGGPDTSFVGGRDPSLVVLGLINKDSTPADVMGYINYVNSESNQAPITLNDVGTTATNAVDFGDTTAGKILGKVTEGKSGLLSFLIGSLFGEKGPSGDATTEQALAIVERAQAESTSALQAQQEARSYADWSGDVGLAGTPSPQVSAPSAPSGIGQPSVDVGASGPGGTVGTPSGVLALSTGAAGPRRSGGLVQNMYDGGVVRMAEGGLPEDQKKVLEARQKVEQIEVPEEQTPTGTAVVEGAKKLARGAARQVIRRIPGASLFDASPAGEGSTVHGNIEQEILHTTPQVHVTRDAPAFGGEGSTINVIPVKETDDIGIHTVFPEDVDPLFEAIKRRKRVAKDPNIQRFLDLRRPTDEHYTFPPVSLHDAKIEATLSSGERERFAEIHSLKETIMSEYGLIDKDELDPFILGYQKNPDNFDFQEGTGALPLKTMLRRYIQIPDMLFFRSPIRWARRMVFSTDKESPFYDKDIVLDQNFNINKYMHLPKIESEEYGTLYMNPDNVPDVLNKEGESVVSNKQRIRLWESITNRAIRFNKLNRSTERDEDWVEFLKKVLESVEADAFGYANFAEGEGTTSLMWLHQGKVKSFSALKFDPTKPEIGQYKGGQVRSMYDGGLV